MMLRSSSTPVLGSLLSSSYSESPNNHHHSETNPSKQRYSLIPFHHNNHNKKLGSAHLINASQSPISHSIADSPVQEFGSNGFRRVQSEGNLEGLLGSSASFEGCDEFDNLVPPKKFSRKQNHMVLETIPSFSFHNSLRLSEGEEEYSDDGGEEERKDGSEEHGAERAEAILDGANFGLEKGYSSVNQLVNLPCQEESQRIVPKTHVAMGLSINDFAGSFGGSYGGGGRNGNGNKNNRGPNGDDGGGASKVEEYYKRMMEENPRDPLFMRNYAEFLCQIKNDLRGAEEYYSRSILADPTDGGNLSQYAKLIWAIHRDQHRAASYFERAVQAAPEDSSVLAAHASFIWETEEVNGGGAPEEDLDKAAQLPCGDAMAAAEA